MKWARFENDRVVELTESDPTGRYHESLTFVPVPDDITENSTLNNGVWHVMRWEYSDEARIKKLKSLIKMLEDDASAAQRVKSYQDELIALESIDESI